ncbi:unnamed protein product [Polarella glacialis]|uniref:Aminotransferase class V domain-containing protein n=1 Tax=Polarella glacialis TaxID=89957 RepID=A0A813EQM8_POLGL|nr:unnamed protein product [Polarella glacialis]
MMRGRIAARAANLVSRQYPCCAASARARRFGSLLHPDEERDAPSYLDMQATTPCDPRVLDAMLPFFHSQFGNPHSRSHSYGWQAEDAGEKAREQIAALIGADPKEIFFTSGATESNNMAIKGIADFYQGTKKHIITSVTYLRVGKDGLVDLKELEDAIREDTALVSVMHINNEIGVLQPIEEIGKICAAKGVFLHTDGAQSVGKIPIDVKKMNVSLMSISGHKLYGPKGIGALYVSRKPRVRLRAVIDGGGQERGMRSGTLPTPLVVGFGKAAEVCMQEMDRDQKHIEGLYKRMSEQIHSQLPMVILNGHETQRCPLSSSIACSWPTFIFFSRARCCLLSVAGFVVCVVVVSCFVRL